LFLDTVPPVFARLELVELVAGARVV